MPEFVAPSGATVVINDAPWSAAKALKKAIQREAALAGLKIDFDQDVSALINVFMQVDGADTVDAALWPCLVRCTRNGEKIQESTFDPTDARQDYYEIVFACLKANLGPLVESLFLKLSVVLAVIAKKRAEKSPESSLTTT